MAQIQVGNSALLAAIDLGTIFDSVADGTFIESATENLAALAGSGNSWPDIGRLVLTPGAAFTLGAAPAWMAAGVITSPDGVTWDIAGAPSGALTPSYGSSYCNLLGSQTYAGSGQSITVNGIIIPHVNQTNPYFKLIAYWKGGVTLPASVAAKFVPGAGGFG